MYLKNKGVVDTHNQSITKINNNDVNLIEIELIKKNSGFPSDSINKSAFLIIYDKDNENKYLYTLIDETGREYYLRTEVEFDISTSSFILSGNIELDKKWGSIALQDDPNTSYQDITTIITNIAPRYNPDEVNRLVDALAHRDEHVHFFKRTGVDNHVPNIHLAHQFPRINMIDMVIRLTVTGRNSNTDYRIWYHNWQNGWEDAICMSAWRNSWLTEVRIGNYSDWDAEDMEVQHGNDRILVRHRENGGFRDREVLMNFDLMYKHLGNMGAGGTVTLPGGAIDVIVNPKFISRLNTSPLPPIPTVSSPSGVPSVNNRFPAGAVANKNVPLGYNPFIGHIFDFELPMFFAPMGHDYGIHGTSYSLTSRSNKQLTFTVGSLSSIPSIGTHRDGTPNPAIVYPYSHYEVWWR